MKKIMMISASNSKESINRTLLDVVSEKINDQYISRIEMRDFNIPIYSSEIEYNDGIPAPILQTKTIFAEHDAFIIASPEHNGTMPAAFKNFIDWLSRAISQGESIFTDKPVLLLSTSPGPRGGATNLQNLVNIMPFWGADIYDSYSIGSYYDNFQDKKFSTKHDQKLTQLVTSLINSLMIEE
jgi:NAD(P)H-dependent FMN reductase